VIATLRLSTLSATPTV